MVRLVARNGPENTTTDAIRFLYEQLGGYDAIAADFDKLLPGRFRTNRDDDGIAREKPLLVDYLRNSAGGPMLYTGRDMPTSHKGMGIMRN